MVKRVIHTTADFDYARNLRFTPGAVAAGVAALQAAAPIVTDTNMALSGHYKAGPCAAEQHSAVLHGRPGGSRAGKGQRHHPGGGVHAKSRYRASRCHPAVGNAPTALLTIADLIETAGAAPCAGHRGAGGLCERCGEQGAAV